MIRLVAALGHAIPRALLILALGGATPALAQGVIAAPTYPGIKLTGGLTCQPGSTCDVSGLGVTATGSDTARTSAVRAADSINALDYTTFAGAVNKAQSTGKSLRLPAGSYSYTGGYLTVAADLIFEPGAVLACGANNLGLNGSITAPATQIFAAGCAPSFYGNNRTAWALPEWWGAKGDSNLTPGNGTDNTVPFQTAMSGGVAGLHLCGNCSYRYTQTLKPGRINFAMRGVDRTVSRMALDDATGSQDGFFADGSATTVGGITLTGIDWISIRQANGYVAAAAPVAGGTGHAVNDIITLPGGTCTTQPQLKVTAVAAGAITGVAVQTPGVCSRRPLQTASLTSFPANAQGNSTGAGTGATFDLRFGGPASIHIRDAYIVRIDHSYLGGANGWNGVFVDQATTTATGKIYISDNIIQNMGNNGVQIWAPNNDPAYYVGDVLIDGRNYIQYAGHAGVEARGNVGGIFVINNEIYNNKWGLFWVAIAANGSNKVRGNDIDTDVLGSFFYNYNSSHFQQNWIASGGPLVCTLCNGVVADGNVFVGKGGPTPGMSQLYLNGTVSFAAAGNLFNGVVSPVQIGSSGATASRAISLTGATHAFGSGAFATLTDGATVGLTVGVQMDNAASAAISGSGQKITVVGQQDTSNSVFDPRSSVLWGQNNSVGQSQSAVGGYANISNGYATTAIGHSNSVTGAFSFVRGWLAKDDNVFGSDCYASGSFDGSTAGQAQTCQHVLRAASSGTAATRLTADGSAAGAANCVNLPNGSHSQLEVRISGRDTTTSGVFADWASVGVAALDRGASASATTYAGSFGTATAAQASAGAGSTATAQISADTANGCLNVTVVPPNANAWRWVATVRRLKMQ